MSQCFQGLDLGTILKLLDLSVIYLDFDRGLRHVHQERMIVLGQDLDLTHDLWWYLHTLSSSIFCRPCPDHSSSPCVSRHIWLRSLHVEPDSKSLWRKKRAPKGPHQPNSARSAGAKLAAFSQVCKPQGHETFWKSWTSVPYGDVLQECSLRQLLRCSRLVADGLPSDSTAAAVNIVWPELSWSCPKSKPLLHSMPRNSEFHCETVKLWAPGHSKWSRPWLLAGLISKCFGLRALASRHLNFFSWHRCTC